MAAELVFSGGHRVRVGTTNAEGLTLTLNRPRRGEEIRSARGSMLPPGWMEVDSDEGPILVNPDQVAYVRDVPDQEPILDEAVEI